MSVEAASPLDTFRWEPQPEVARFYDGIIDDFLRRCPPAAQLAERMLRETGTRFRDWIDHLALPQGYPSGDWAGRLGFVYEGGGADSRLLHPGGIFPPIQAQPAEVLRVFLKVDSALHFLLRNDGVVDVLPEGATRIPTIEGLPFSAYRRACAFTGDGAELWVAERHGYTGFIPGDGPPDPAAVLRHHEAFQTRPRDLADDAEGFEAARRLIDVAIDEIGRDRACDLFFDAEREYWRSRNRAAQIQRARQDALGLGWANHDHHTYRSSREWFVPLIALFERLGFYCRERFYAGREAGWGAQVLEHPVTGIVIFADVDMSPDELLSDFAHEPMAARHELGTVGLWCKLHGEALLQAGMHHLECTFAFDTLKEQMESECGVRVMKPFTDFPFLRQAFTEGERWPVSEDRIRRLLERGQITQDQAAQFREHGALGSHLENLERNDGYKGFNQQGVSEIIAATDPRRHT